MAYCGVRPKAPSWHDFQQRKIRIQKLEFTDLSNIKTDIREVPTSRPRQQRLVTRSVTSSEISTLKAPSTVGKTQRHLTQHTSSLPPRHTTSSSPPRYTTSSPPPRHTTSSPPPRRIQETTSSHSKPATSSRTVKHAKAVTSVRSKSAKDSKVPTRRKPTLHRTRSAKSLPDDDLPDDLCVSIAEVKPREIGMRQNAYKDIRLYINDNNDRCQQWLSEVESKELIDLSVLTYDSGEEVEVPSELPESIDVFEYEICNSNATKKLGDTRGSNTVHVKRIYVASCESY